MAQAQTAVMAVVLEQRTETALAFQERLTRSGCIIRTRIGVHEGCENKGLIILHLEGAGDQINELERSIAELPGARVQTMTLEM